MGRGLANHRVPARRGVVAALVVAAACAGGGCTICPDPFDYSGPVPDGTPPQNDFRARSGGIHPLSAVPMPWPAVVHADGVPEPAPETVDSERQVVDDADTAALQQTSVLVPAADGEPAANGGEPQPAAESRGAETPLVPVPAAAASESLDDEPVANVGEQAAPTSGEAAETPGWRSRRRSGG